MTRQPFHAARGSQQLRYLRIALFEILQVRRLFHSFLYALGAVRYQVGNLVDVRIRHSHGAPDILDGLLGFHAAKSDDLRNVLHAIFINHVLDQPVAPFVGNVGIDVGHGNSLGIEEPFEDQAKPDRIQLGDLHGIGHQRPGRRAAPRPDGDAVGFAGADHVRDNQKVPGKFHLLDDSQFVTQTILVFVGDHFDAETFFQATAGHFFKVCVKGHPFRDFELWQ